MVSVSGTRMNIYIKTQEALHNTQQLTTETNFGYPGGSGARDIMFYYLSAVIIWAVVLPGVYS